MREHALKSVGLATVDGEPILTAHLHDTACEPALVLLGQPFGGVMITLSLSSTSVYLRARKRAVQDVTGKIYLGGEVLLAKSAVMRFGSCDDVFNVGFSLARKVTPRVWAVDAAPHFLADLQLH